jgi:hypothetical protein
MRTPRSLTGILKSSLVLLILVLLYAFVYAPWQQHWGATDAEVQMTLPGDELVPKPLYQSTRAITIQATPAHIMPWLKQIGQNRGGYYSYDWLENLFGLNIHTADTLMAGKQARVGDLLAVSDDTAMGFRVYQILPDTAFVCGMTMNLKTNQEAFPNDSNLTTTIRGIWAFYLLKDAPNRTRLIVRLTVHHPKPTILFGLGSFVVANAHFIMEQKMMRTLRDKAEGRKP